MLTLRCQCLDFQMAFKICCINHDNDVAEKLKETTDNNQNNIESEKKHLNKQTEKCILNTTCH